MIEERQLTADEKKAVLRDFKAWNDGIPAAAADDGEISRYVESGMDADLPTEAVRTFLFSQSE